MTMDDEVDAQLCNNTYELVPPKPNHNVIDTKWIFTLKYLPNGVIDMNKARLVARAFYKPYGHAYFEMFSLVIKLITIRQVLQLTISRSSDIKQLDVNNAFFQSTLTYEVYVSQSHGFGDKDISYHVCAMGFLNSLANINVNGDQIVYYLVYVDDIVVTGSRTTLIQCFIHALASRF